MGLLEGQRRTAGPATSTLLQAHTDVPFVDLRAQHEELRQELRAAFDRVIDDSAFVDHGRIEAFEHAFATYCGSRYSVALSNGTSALTLALQALGIGAGDVVITVPNTFIATAEAIVQVGAVPRFVDIDPHTYNMAASHLHEYLDRRCFLDSTGTPRERDGGLRVAAVLPVHLYGLPADMAAIRRIANEYGLKVVEDACQAHGAECQVTAAERARAGSMGDAGCFSFYPSKNLGALGEGGALVTSDAGVAQQAALLRDHGQSERYVHVTAQGVNARMHALQAELLTIKLGRLDAWNDARRQVAAWYQEDLAGSGIQLPVEPAGYRHVYHLYVVRVPDRDRVRALLAEHGISTGLHYPLPLHLQPGFAGLELPKGSLPEAERAAAEILSLPMYPHLSRDQVGYVAESLRGALR